MGHLSHILRAGFLFILLTQYALAQVESHKAGSNGSPKVITINCHSRDFSESEGVPVACLKKLMSALESSGCELRRGEIAENDRFRLKKFNIDKNLWGYFEYTALGDTNTPYMLSLRTFNCGEAEPFDEMHPTGQLQKRCQDNFGAMYNYKKLEIVPNNPQSRTNQSLKGICVGPKAVLTPTEGTPQEASKAD